MRRRVGQLCAAVFVAVALGLLFHPVLLVELIRTDGLVLWAARADHPERLEIDYTHSVERTPVLEVYEVSPRGLRLVGMEFVSQGAGLPSEGFVLERGRFVLRTDRPLHQLSLRVTRLSSPRLTARGRALDLVSAAGEGAEVVLGARSRPWALWLLSSRR